MPRETEVTDDIEEMGNTVSTDDAGGPKGSEKPVGAASSTDTDVSNTVADEDALSVVRDVVDKRKDAEASSATTVEEVAPATGRTTRQKEPDNEGYSDVPFNKHPRFQELLQQRDGFKTDAVRYRNVQNFIEENGLTAEEAAEMLLVGGMMKVDPVAAWKRIQPTIQNLLIAAGEVLPNDLKARVEKGEMSREAALDLSRTRAAVESGRAQMSFSEQRTKLRQSEEMSQRLMDTAYSWETDRRRRDPNFDAKLTDIRKEISWLQRQEGIPQTPPGVQDQLRRAYETVNKSFRAPRRAISPVNGGQVSGNAQPAPRNTMDLIRAEVAKRQAQ